MCVCVCWCTKARMRVFYKRANKVRVYMRLMERCLNWLSSAQSHACLMHFCINGFCFSTSIAARDIYHGIKQRVYIHALRPASTPPSPSHTVDASQTDAMANYTHSLHILIRFCTYARNRYTLECESKPKIIPLLF